MKRSPLRKKSTQSLSVLQRKLWELCRKLAAKLYKPYCYTCGAGPLSGHNKQLGHMWAKASLGAWLKYDMRVLRWQCSRCNLWLGGMGAQFYASMLSEIGQEAMDDLNSQRTKLVKASEHYPRLIDEYTRMCGE